MMKSYSIYDDLTGISEMPRGDGGFETKLAALERLVVLLEGERARTGAKLANARRALTRERARS